MQITHSAAKFGGPFAIAIARGIYRQEMLGTQLNILVPVTGTAVSRQCAELAIALAQASQGSVAALHVASGQRRARSWQRLVGAALAPVRRNWVFVATNALMLGTALFRTCITNDAEYAAVNGAVTLA